MATSPREELLIRSVTEFTEDERGFWSWQTRVPNGIVVLKAEDLADSLEDAVGDFFSRVGYDPAVVDTDDTKAHFSELIMISDNDSGYKYHIREYAHGAPNPFPAKGLI